MLPLVQVSASFVPQALELLDNRNFLDWISLRLASLELRASPCQKPVVRLEQALQQGEARPITWTLSKRGGRVKVSCVR